MSAEPHKNCRKIYLLSRAVFSIWVACKIHVLKASKAGNSAPSSVNQVNACPFLSVTNTYHEPPLLLTSCQCLTSVTSVVLFVSSLVYKTSVVDSYYWFYFFIASNTMLSENNIVFVQSLFVACLFPTVCPATQAVIFSAPRQNDHGNINPKEFSPLRLFCLSICADTANRE